MKVWNDKSLWDSLEMERAESPCVISIVGSGGKTSLMGQLAEEGKEHDLKVAVMTTSHIWKPSVYEEAFSHIEKGSVKVFGKADDKGKLTYPGDDCFAEILNEADLILIEADGSRGFPVKYPAEYEPIIPKQANKIVCVCGLSGLGKQAGEVCHRFELARENLSKIGIEFSEETEITEEILTCLLEKGYGESLTKQNPQAEFYYCMNQADNESLYHSAERMLKAAGWKGMILSMLGEENPIYRPFKVSCIYMASGFGKRYGSNKLLAEIDGKLLYHYGLETLRRAKEIIQKELNIELDVIVVSQYEEILKAAEESTEFTVYNPDSQDGISASIRHGIKKAQPSDAYLFAVADQPWIKPTSVVKLIKEFCSRVCDKSVQSAFKDVSRYSIACLCHDGRRGNPVIFSNIYKEELLNLTGDKGGSQILKKHIEEVLLVEAEEQELQDIDYPME